MPIAIIAKIMARELSHLGYAKISHDAKSLMQEAATEFICFLMSEANDQALAAKRKSVTGQDFISIHGCVQPRAQLMACDDESAVNHWLTTDLSVLQAWATCSPPSRTPCPTFSLPSA